MIIDDDDMQEVIDLGVEAGLEPAELRLWMAASRAMVAALDRQPQLDQIRVDLQALSSAQRIRVVQACILVGKEARAIGLG